MLVGGLVLAAVLVAGCEEELIEPFPDMTPPPASMGGIRGHMHGGASEVVLCTEKWEVEWERITTFHVGGALSPAEQRERLRELAELAQRDPDEFLERLLEQTRGQSEVMWEATANCLGEAWGATVDASANDLFFFEWVEPGDYWLLGKGCTPQDPRSWCIIGEHGHRVTVKEGQWTDVPSNALSVRRLPSSYRG